MNRSIFVIIPVFNEESVIRKVIRDVKKAGFKHIIAVDDGSDDNSFEEIKKTGVLTLRHSINRGKGAAVKTGMEAAKMLGAASVVTFDGDGQHAPGDIAKLLTYLRKGYDVVLGTRFAFRQDIPLVKRIANFGANILTYVLYGIWVADSQSGFRAYSRNAFFAIDTRSDRYEFDSEVIREIAQKKLRFIEIPIRVRYTDYSQKKKNRQDILSAWSSVIRMVLLS